MVAGPRVDLAGAVDLFQQHHPRQMVGEGHGGHGQAEKGQGLDAGVQAEGPADQKDQMTLALGGGVRHEAGQVLAG